jgi:uncharacterized protein YukE
MDNSWELLGFDPNRYGSKVMESLFGAYSSTVRGDLERLYEHGSHELRLAHQLENDDKAGAIAKYKSALKAFLTLADDMSVGPINLKRVILAGIGSWTIIGALTAAIGLTIANRYDKKSQKEHDKLVDDLNEKASQIKDPITGSSFAVVGNAQLDIDAAKRNLDAEIRGHKIGGVMAISGAVGAGAGIVGGKALNKSQLKQAATEVANKLRECRDGLKRCGDTTTVEKFDQSVEDAAAKLKRRSSN